MRNIFGCLTLTGWLLATPLAFPAENAPAWDALFSTGVGYRQQGHLELSIAQFTQARQVGRTDDERMRSAGELGASLLQARRFDAAQAALQEAYGFFAGTARAPYALDLGNLAFLRKREADAWRFYEEALQLAGNDADIATSAKLNLARLAPEGERLQKLTALFSVIGTVEDPRRRAQLYLNLGAQARSLGQSALAVAYQSIHAANELFAPMAKDAMAVEALDAMAQLYEDQGRMTEALQLTQRALSSAQRLPTAHLGVLWIALEWRYGRLTKSAQPVLALAAYQRAVEHIERLRQDIPIEYEDGRSSFGHTLEPVYLGYVDLLLQQADQQTPADQSEYFRRVRDTVELVKQAELQDFLGDRCAVETLGTAGTKGLPPTTAVLYPILLPDRLELLLEVQGQYSRRSVSIAKKDLHLSVVALARSLRNGDYDYRKNAQKLYDWLLRPLEAELNEKQINTLVLVPDGVLRLVPMAALHDGKHYAIEKYAISTVTAMTMTDTRGRSGRAVRSLVAGASEFGPVVDKLDSLRTGQIFGTERSLTQTGVVSKLNPSTLRAPRIIGTVASISPSNDAASQRNIQRDSLRESLALPGVKVEIEAISDILRGKRMLNDVFTMKGFRGEAESGGYNIIHIASHGVFGKNAHQSFILTYDDLLTLDDLQSVLKSDEFRQNPIELLSLSACETAEGDDRSPLGISGAAIKARAKSVLGTLWPVDDTAARTVMEKFYNGLTLQHLDKAAALRNAQIELIHNQDLAHPLFWAPFLLIGNWL